MTYIRLGEIVESLLISSVCLLEVVHHQVAVT